MIWTCRECELDVEKMIKEIAPDPMRVCEICKRLTVCYAYEGALPEKEIPESIVEPVKEKKGKKKKEKAAKPEESLKEAVEVTESIPVPEVEQKTVEEVIEELETETVEEAVEEDTESITDEEAVEEVESVTEDTSEEETEVTETNTTVSIDEQIAELQRKKEELEK